MNLLELRNHLRAAQIELIKACESSYELDARLSMNKITENVRIEISKAEMWVEMELIKDTL